MRLPRMTTRRWLIAIAAGAVLLAAEMTRRRWVDFRRHIAYHAHAEACYRVGLVDCLREVEEGERQSRRLSVNADGLTLALEPFHRFVDSKPDYQAYWTAMNLPLSRKRLEQHKANIAYHAAMRRKYELASRRPWLLVEPDPWP